METTQQKRVLIADTTAGFADQLSRQLGEGYSFWLCQDGTFLWTRLEQIRPQVLVMDLALPGQDGVELLEQLRQLPQRPKVLLTTCFMSPYIESAISSCGVDMVMMKPCCVDAMARRIRELTREADMLDGHLPKGEHTVSGLLLELSFTPKRKGFGYLHRSIERYGENPCQMMTKHLYPKIAEEFNTNPTAVERAIRQVIQEAWRCRNELVWGRYFHKYPDGMLHRPTNAEFISRIAMWYTSRETIKA